MSDVSFPIDHFVSKNNSTLSSLNPVQSSGTDSSGIGEEATLLNQEILHILKNHIGLDKFNTYFEDKFKVVEVTPDLVKCSVSTPFIKKIIESQYISSIKNALKNCMGKDYQLEIYLHGEQKQYNQTENAVLHPSIILKNEENALDDYQVQKGKTVKETSFTLNDIAPQTVSPEIHRASAHNEYQQIDPKKHFDAFVVGPSNNLAHASAVAVAKNPGEIYQALYL